MKKIILFLTLITLSLASCRPNQHSQNHQVSEYRHYDDATNSWLWYYVLFNNGTRYYYSSPTQITNYSSISNWSRNSFSNYTPSSEELSNTESISTNELNSEFTESNGFESAETGYSESSGFESSDNSSTESSGFESSDNGFSESGGFDSGSSDGGGGE